MSLHAGQPAPVELPEHVRMYALFSAGIDAIESDPVRAFHFSSAEQRAYAEGMGRGLMVYLSGANKTGKTHINAYWGVCAALGDEWLGSEGDALFPPVRMPSFPSPCIGMVFSLDYPQQIGSVQRAYIEAVGNLEHRALWDGEVLKSLRIRPRRCKSDDPKDWSIIRFLSQKNLGTGIGARSHWSQFDEPPIMKVYQEALKAGFAGEPYSCGITATPLKRSQWWPLRAYFPKEAEGRVHDGLWLRLRVPVSHNRALQPHEVEGLHKLYANDIDKDARLYGMEIDTEGASPFHRNYAELSRWLERCTAGRWETWRVSCEQVTQHGTVVVQREVSLQIWEDFDPACSYRVLADPSLGIDDGLHDPCEADVFNMTTGNQALRYSGYIGAYGLGVLSAGLARRYEQGGRQAKFHPMVTGGLGSSLLRGYSDAGGRNLHTDELREKVGGMNVNDVGTVETGETRAEHMEAINEALTWSASGALPFLTVNCAESVVELQDLILKNGKPVTGGGRHDEALALIGRAALLLSPSRRRALGKPVPVKQDSPRDIGMRSYRLGMGLPALPVGKRGALKRTRGAKRAR